MGRHYPWRIRTKRNLESNTTTRLGGRGPEPPVLDQSGPEYDGRCLTVEETTSGAKV